MGLKSCRLWAMGQLDSNVQSPNTCHTPKGYIHHSSVISSSKTSRGSYSSL
jgi:hypothetical protein